MTDPGRVAGTILCLMVQGLLWRAALFVVGGTVVFYCGLIILVTSIAASIWSVVKGHSGFSVAAGGCALQVAAPATVALAG